MAVRNHDELFENELRLQIVSPLISSICFNKKTVTLPVAQWKKQSVKNWKGKDEPKVLIDHRLLENFLKREKNGPFDNRWENLNFEQVSLKIIKFVPYVRGVWRKKMVVKGRLNIQNKEMKTSEFNDCLRIS